MSHEDKLHAVSSQQRKIDPAHAIKAYGGEEVQQHSFLTSAPDGGKWSTSRFGRFAPRKEPLVPIKWETRWNQAPVWECWR
jgi:hypothetical protein